MQGRQISEFKMKRRRVCYKCLHRYTTYEEIVSFRNGRPKSNWS